MTTSFWGRLGSLCLAHGTGTLARTEQLANDTSGEIGEALSYRTAREVVDCIFDAIPYIVLFACCALDILERVQDLGDRDQVGVMFGVPGFDMLAVLI